MAGKAQIPQNKSPERERNLTNGGREADNQSVHPLLRGHSQERTTPNDGQHQDETQDKQSTKLEDSKARKALPEILNRPSKKNNKQQESQLQVAKHKASFTSRGSGGGGGGGGSTGRSSSPVENQNELEGLVEQKNKKEDKQIPRKSATSEPQQRISKGITRKESANKKEQEDEKALELSRRMSGKEHSYISFAQHLKAAGGTMPKFAFKNDISALRRSFVKNTTDNHIHTNYKNRTSEVNDYIIKDEEEKKENKYNRLYNLEENIQLDQHTIVNFNPNYHLKRMNPQITPKQSSPVTVTPIQNSQNNNSNIGIRRSYS